jgi:hypothetical protein
MSELGIAIPFGALLLALVGWVVILSRSVGKLEGQCDVLGCIPEMKRQLERLVYRQELLDTHAADVLHGPEHRERDELVRGLLAGTLTRAEVERVAELLRQAKTSDPVAEKRFYALLLLGRAEWELTATKRRINAE